MAVTLGVVVAVVIGYLLGSISFSLLIAKWRSGIDLRRYGSGNAGATNTLRVLGKGPAVIVLALDVFKGVVAVLFASSFVTVTDGYATTETQQLAELLAGLAAIVGHNWPIFFRFRGGKGVATTIGVLCTLFPVPSLIAGAVAVIVLFVGRFVSVASLTFAASVPIVFALYGFSMIVIGWSLVIGALMAWQHRSNVRNLLQGKEHRFGARSRGGRS